MSYRERFNGSATYMTLALLFGQLGFVVVFPIVAGAWLGRYLDRWLGTHGLMVIMAILLGVVIGVYEAWALISSILRAQEDTERKQGEPKE